MTSADTQERFKQLSERLRALDLGKAGAEFAAAFNAPCGPGRIELSDEERARMLAAAARVGVAMQACVEAIRPGLARLADSRR